MSSGPDTADGAPRRSGPGTGVGPSRAAAVAALAGAAVMSLELTAVRLLAPHFGDSAYVWTNAIGVMLVALTLGAWVGGRMADPRRGTARLGWAFTVAGVLTAAVPLVAGDLGSWLLPQQLPLDDAMPALVRGSLAATLLLFAPPVMLLGSATPVLVARLAHAGMAVGRASGLVVAAATIGSLIGTFATTHLLVPGVGSRATVWLCAAAALLCAALLAPRPGRVGLVLLPLALTPWSWGPLRPPAPGRELLAEVESRYQYLQVVAEEEEGRRTVLLTINEGLDSFHSVVVEGTPWTGGRYYDYHAVAPFLVGDGAVPQKLRVLSMGAAAGTFARLFAGVFPGSVVDGVEIDPAVVALGERWFGGRRASGRVWAGLDARVFAEHAERTYDLVLVDAYERQIYVPAHVASRQFFSAVQERLRPGGVVAVNAGGRTFEDPVVEAVAATMAAVFGDSRAFRVPRSRNFVLLARRGAPPDPTVLAGVRVEDPELARVLAAAAQPGAWRRFAAGDGPLLEDDRPLLDSLQEAALARRGGGEGVIPMQGPVAVAVAEREARQRMAESDWEGALAALRRAREPAPVLRALAGDLRWHLHDPSGARSEYRAALERGAEGELREFVEARLAELAPVIARGERARDVATRNALLAVVGAGWLLAWALGARRLSRG